MAVESKGRGLKALAMVIVATITLGAEAADASQHRASDVESAIKGLSGSEQECAGVLNTISEMGPEAKDAVPKLIDLIQSDPSMQIRGECAKALGSIGVAASSAVPALIVFLENSGGGYERTYACTALGNIGQQPDQAVPALVQALQHDGEPVVRHLAARALGDFGPKAGPAIPSLIEAIKNGDQDMRDAAAYGLAKIPARPADVPSLVAMLTDPIDSDRIAAAKSIGAAGSEGTSAVPALIALLSDKVTEVRAAAAISLGEIGPDAKASIPALKIAVKDAQIRAEAQDALRQIRDRN